MESADQHGHPGTGGDAVIPIEEIKTAARTAGVPTSTIERDYAQDWLLANLGDQNLALKGGTGIRKAYIPDYRFSDDLDFTIMGSVDIETIHDILDAALAQARKAGGIPFETALALRENRNGYVTDVFFPMLLSGHSRVKIKVDITRSSVEGNLLPFVFKKINHPYSDRCEGAVMVFSLEEMAAEKVRSVFQRTRARDIFDVHRLVVGQMVDIKILNGILRKKFEKRSIDADVGRIQARKPEFGNGWNRSLQHQMHNVPDFEHTFGEVLSVIGQLELH
jgi:predicted nucleotidyltransferase component of viral defense system